MLDALDAVGLRGDGRLLQLNSYENRVFQVMLEDGGAVAAKFYRPGRWTDGQIAEEHVFAAALAAAEVPVVAPLALADGSSLAHALIDGHDFRLAAYPMRAGHGPELDDPETLRWLGRCIGRLHLVGAQQPFLQRRRLDASTFGHAALARLLALDVIPPAQLTRGTAPAPRRWPPWMRRWRRHHPHSCGCTVIATPATSCGAMWVTVAGHNWWTWMTR